MTSSDEVMKMSTFLLLALSHSFNSYRVDVATLVLSVDWTH